MVFGACRVMDPYAEGASIIASGIIVEDTAGGRSGVCRYCKVAQPRTRHVVPANKGLGWMIS
jgi:hypothetical protein